MKMGLHRKYTLQPRYLNKYKSTTNYYNFRKDENLTIFHHIIIIYYIEESGLEKHKAQGFQNEYEDDRFKIYND